MYQLLIAEDEPKLRTALTEYFQKNGYLVNAAEDGTQAIKLIEKDEFDLAILDIMLPGEIDGFTVCSKIREESNTHILIASAKTDKESKLKGLDLGADDYIEKPYDIDILLAKIKGIFKRKFSIDEIVEGDMKLNCATKALFIKGEKVEVTAKEFDLLKLLIDNKGVTLKKSFIFNSIWGSDSESEMQTLNVHIKWLREKIESDPKNPEHILTVWGVGYRFE